MKANIVNFFINKDNTNPNSKLNKTKYVEYAKGNICNIFFKVK